jgi:BirA family biotin operon repressor/biotin-[acetyl-CoA-carboxylase] ligase
MGLDERLDRIVDLLAQHRSVVSGTRVAQATGTTDDEVWRLIQLLRRLGVEIEGSPASGYVLHARPDLLLPSILAPRLHGTLFQTGLHHYYKIRSTNAVAMKAALDGAPEGTVFVAEEQTAGRGRGGHTWYSAPGVGIYCSLLLKPAMLPSDSLLMSLAAALAVHAAVDATKPENRNLRVDLKWPNDLLVGGKKFCGILTEMNAEATRVRHLVIGIGINVNHPSFPPHLQANATSLRLAIAALWSRVDLMVALLKFVHREYRELQSGGRESILRRFCSLSSMVNARPVWVEENGGFQGITEGLDAHGFLRVRTAEGLQTVLSGTVRSLKV